MANACVYIRRAYISATAPALITVEMEMTTELAISLFIDHAVEITPATSAQQLRNQVEAAARTRLGELGYPVAQNESVTIFGSNS
jgi:uncharacterized protein YueI